MSIILLANIGNSDLRAQVEADTRLTTRQLGETVRDKYEEYRDNVTLPLLDPVLKLLGVSGPNTKVDITLHLFASDQKPDLAASEEYQKDTYPVAEAIQVHLHRAFGISKKQIRLHKIEGSPADYTNMLKFHREALHAIRKYVKPEDAVYLEVSGGTPAMAAMLILVGTEVFGQQARTLYLDRSSPDPYEIDIVNYLFADQMRDVLEEQIKLYAYSAARRTLELHGTVIVPDQAARMLAQELAAYADRRLAFDFGRAKQHLQEAQKRATGETQAQLRLWMRQFSNPDDATLIEELLHSASIKQSLGDYADFVARIFRLQEALFRYMASQVGLQYGDSEQYASSSWLKTQPDLEKFLANYQRLSDGRITPVDLKRSLNRFSLGAVVDYFVRHDTQWQHWQAPAEQIHRLTAVAELRNKGISGHGFQGVGAEDIAAGYGASAEEILRDLSRVFEQIFGRPPSENPYETIKRILSDQIETAR